MSKCRICGWQSGETRLGTCFDCAEAESIIKDGTDMYDKGDATTSMEKLKMLIERGWHLKGRCQGNQSKEEEGK